MTTEIERTKEALLIAREALVDLSSGAVTLGHIRQRSEEAEARIRAILQPPPEFEYVPVERWECNKCGSIYANDGMGQSPLSTGAGYDECNQCGAVGMVDPIKLTGTRKVAKKQKVQRSVSVEGVQINDIGQPRYNLSPILKFSEAKGKTVTLTATWEE